MPRIKVEDQTEQTNTGQIAQSLPKTGKVAPDLKTTATTSGESLNGVSPVDAELQKKSGSFLSSFIAYPPGVSFSEQEAGEDIILLLRAHVVTNIPWILIVAGLLVTPLIIFPILSVVGVLPSVGMGLSVVLTIFWYAVTFTYAFISFLYWYFNVYIVTNERVVDVDWYSVVYRKVSSTQIAKIQDVSATQSGVFAGIFDFGSVQIQTAGEEENFEFDYVPHPQLIAKKLQDLMQKEEAQFEHEPNL